MIIELTISLGLILFTFYAGYFLLMWVKTRSVEKAKGSGNAKMKSYTPYVSIVIPTFNEENTIIQKLNNLIEQDYKNYEVIIIDSASEDRTVELVKGFIRKHKNLNFKLIVENERRGKAQALNEAFKHCSGEIIVITDADAIWEKESLKKIVSNFSDPTVGAITGRQILLNKNQSLATKVENTYRNIYEVLRLGESVMDSTPIFHGEISCFRRSLVEEISENSMADDSELAVKVRKKGFKSIYDPNAIFYEYAPPTFKSRFVQKLRRGQGLIQLFWKEKGILFNPRYGKFGMLIFPAEFFMHVISPLLVLGFIISLFYTLFSLAPHVLIHLSTLATISLALFLLTKVDVLNIALSFLNSQMILLTSLIYQLVGKKQHKWKKVIEIRELWKTDVRTL